MRHRGRASRLSGRSRKYCSNKVASPRRQLKPCTSSDQLTVERFTAPVVSRLERSQSRGGYSNLLYSKNRGRLVHFVNMPLQSSVYPGCTRVLCSEQKEQNLSRPRIELRTFCVLDRCDNQLRHRPVQIGTSSTDICANYPGTIQAQRPAQYPPVMELVQEPLLFGLLCRSTQHK